MDESATTVHECDTDPKLTAEEWAYIEAMSKGAGN